MDKKLLKELKALRKMKQEFADYRDAINRFGVVWCAEDIQDRAKAQGKRISLKRAKELLAEMADGICEGMLQAGWASIDLDLRQGT